MEAGLHVARFSKKIWICKFLYRKILKKIIVVDNTLIYHCENFQSKIPCILFWAKKRKSTKLTRWTVRNLNNLKSCQIYLFCIDQNISNLRLKFFTVVDHSIIYYYNFFQNFLKIKFADSIFFGKPGYM